MGSDPMFVDPYTDCHLQDDSPCIDAGTSSGAPSDDIEGNPRDGFPDMGAYESIPTIDELIALIETMSLHRGMENSL